MMNSVVPTNESLLQRNSEESRGVFKYKNILRGKLTSASCSQSAPDLGFPGSLATPHPTKSEQIRDSLVAKYLFCGNL
jgi:hypothetical protein